MAKTTATFVNEAGRRVRRCEHCGEVKPLTRHNFYLRRGADPAQARSWRYICKTCFRERALQRPRACLRCHEVKPGDDFDMGPAGKYRRGVCRACIAQDGERVRTGPPRKWATFERGGELVRRCYRCEGVFPLSSEHFYAGRPGEGVQSFDYRCKACARAESQRRYREQMADAVRAEQRRLKNREHQQRYKSRHPERTRESARRSAERTMRDPAKHRRRLETQRIAAALRRERKTGKLRQRAAPQGMRFSTEGEAVGLLPALPLARAIERLIANDHLRLVGDDQSHAEAICEGLGIDSRNLRAWLSGERAEVQGDIVDRILTNAGWHWWDVYDAEVCGEEVATKAARLLGGEEAVAI